MSIKSLTPLWTQFIRWNNWLLLSLWNSSKFRLITVLIWLSIASYRASIKFSRISWNLLPINGSSFIRKVGTNSRHFRRCNAWFIKISAARILSSCGTIKASFCNRSTLLKFCKILFRHGPSSMYSCWLISAMQSWISVMRDISHIGSRIRARNVRLPSDVTQ